MATARSTPNIALIKYWGNRNDELRLPAADSVSMTLDSPHVDITVEKSDEFALESFQRDGSPKKLLEKDVARFKKHIVLVRQYMKVLGVDFPSEIFLRINSHIPPAIGIASSAAVFSALAKAYAELVKGDISLDDRQISIIARLGSGSAARSIFGGFGSLLAGRGEEIDASYGEQIADEHHWKLHDIIIVPSQDEKKVGSTEGHANAWTSPLYKKRLEQMAQRNHECRSAILHKDFEKLQRIAEEDALDMHRVMETQTPSLKYLSEVTHRIIRDVTALRTSENIPVLYTMDAGPTVHLFCLEEAKNVIVEFAKTQKDCDLFETSVGAGTSLLP